MNSRKRILFITATPSSLTSTNWEIEHNRIRSVINHKNYELDLICRATPEEISKAMPDECWMVHFSGHGKPGGKIFLEDGDNGEFIPRNRDLMEVLTTPFGVQCILFNSCYSHALAQLAAEYVDYAIGVTGTIENDPAIEFVSLFYESFAKYETIPMAYKDAARKFSFSKKKEVEVIFECRNAAIMEMVLQDKLAELKQIHERGNLLDEEIDRINGEISQLRNEQKEMLSGLLKKNPHPFEVLWFTDAYEQLATNISDKLLSESSNDMRQDFALELSYLFGLLKACMVMNDNLYSSEDLGTLKSGNFSKTQIEQAFDELPHHVLDPYKKRGFVPFLKDHIKHMKSLL